MARCVRSCKWGAQTPPSCPARAWEPWGRGGVWRHLRVGLAIGHVRGGSSLRAPRARLLEHLLGPLGHPGWAFLHAAFVSHPVWGTETRVAVGTPGAFTPDRHPRSPASWPEGHSQASSWVQLGGGEGILAGRPLLRWRWGFHALEHERCPVLGKQRAVCVHRGQVEEGAPGSGSGQGCSGEAMLSPPLG